MTRFTQVRIGCQVGEQAPPNYWNEFQTFELSERVLETVKQKTLRKWRDAAPPTTTFVPIFGGKAVVSGLAESGEASWARLASLCETLESQTVLLRTPSTFRPSESNRQALKAFMAHRPASIQCAWWAEGLWESDPESTDALCSETGLLRVVDPLGLDDDDELPRMGLLHIGASWVGGA